MTDLDFDDVLKLKLNDLLFSFDKKMEFPFAHGQESPKENVVYISTDMHRTNLFPINQLIMGNAISQGLADGLSHTKDLLKPLDEKNERKSNKMGKLSTQQRIELQKNEVKMYEKKAEEVQTRFDQLVNRLHELEDQLASEEAAAEDKKRTECTITMRPVCECGHIFKDLKIDLASIVSLNNLLCKGQSAMVLPRFDPVYCPECKRRIMGIVDPVVREGCNGEQYIFTEKTND